MGNETYVPTTLAVDSEGAVYVNYVHVVIDPFEAELEVLIQRHGKDANTQAFQLAQYLVRALDLFNQTVKFREAWYGRG